MTSLLDLATPFPESVAAVDLGSNSFHLVVARTTSGEPVVVDRLREMVQLAAGLDESRRLSRESRERALECLRRFGERVRHMPESCVRAVGTNTLRRARGVKEFLAAAEEALGHPIETISGIEEARLIYLGVVHSLAASDARRLVVDIGGGSTELIVGQSFEPTTMESLYMGCVSISRAHFSDGEIGKAAWERAELEALRELEPIRTRFRNLGWEQAIGASGTVRAVERVVRESGWSKGGIGVKALERLRDEMLAAGHADRLEMPGLSADRRRVFAGGVVVLAAAFEALGIESMQYSEGALREGVLYDLLGRIRNEDVRGRTVSALGDRYHVDWKQATRVESTALGLLEKVAAPWRLTSVESRQILSWAAQLHEIGLDIAHAQYHRHGEYVIASSDMLGFSRDEQRMLATLVRGHRRKLPLSTLAALPRQEGRRIERLAILLRIAVVLHRSRSPDAVPEPDVAAERKSLRLAFPKGWLAQHPLTAADLGSESDYLASVGYRLEVT
jgi:exopolyphosphatase/guanosine-5'-triphosphate,3'-diphosphate pyrophosphatase